MDVGNNLDESQQQCADQQKANTKERTCTVRFCFCDTQEQAETMYGDRKLTVVVQGGGGGLKAKGTSEVKERSCNLTMW